MSVATRAGNTRIDTWKSARCAKEWPDSVTRSSAMTIWKSGDMRHQLGEAPGMRVGRKSHLRYRVTISRAYVEWFRPSRPPRSQRGRGPSLALRDTAPGPGTTFAIRHASPRTAVKVKRAPRARAPVRRNGGPTRTHLLLSENPPKAGAVSGRRHSAHFKIGIQPGRLNTREPPVCDIAEWTFRSVAHRSQLYHVRPGPRQSLP